MIFIFGNGLSIGFDSRLETRAITERVIATLGDSYTDVLQTLTDLGAPEDPDTAPVAVNRGSFEQLAGPLDRLSDALVAVQRLFIGPSTSELLAKLRDAADGLRQQYVHVVGTVLREVDACCIETTGVDEERRASWEAMNVFAAELIERDATIFNLSYDSLLVSSLLNQTDHIYDGFPFRSLNVPLDRWAGTTAHYQLHGSVAWHRVADGSVHKMRLQEMRNNKILEGWAAGDVSGSLPAVILTDLKTPDTQQYPFSIFYEELYRQLLNESLVVVGGYSFGDRPLNRALSWFLSRNPSNRLLVWNPSGTPDAYLNRLSMQLAKNESAISASQITVKQVWLPDATAVRKLT
jgi:hypothetical protein